MDPWYLNYHYYGTEAWTPQKLQRPFTIPPPAPATPNSRLHPPHLLHTPSRPFHRPYARCVQAPSASAFLLPSAPPTLHLARFKGRLRATRPHPRVTP